MIFALNLVAVAHCLGAYTAAVHLGAERAWRNNLKMLVGKQVSLDGAMLICQVIDNN